MTVNLNSKSSHFEPALKSSKINVPSYGLQRIVGSNDQPVVLEGNHATLSLPRLVLPGIRPQLQMVHEGFRFLYADVVNHYGFLPLITIPPLVGELLVVRTFAGSTSLSSTRLSPEPLADLRRVSRRDSHVVLLNALQSSVATDADVGRDAVNVSLLRVLPHVLPVSSLVATHRFHAVLPGSIHAGLLLQAIPIGTVVELYGCPMRFGNFGYTCDAHRLLEAAVELQMNAVSRGALL